MSLPLFGRIIQPQIARLISTVGSFRPDPKVMLHSDGEVSKLLPIFVELGVDVLNPLEPVEAVVLP